MLATLGMTFEIAEISLKDLLLERMKHVDIKKSEQEIKERVKHTARHPKPIFTNARCQKHRKWIFDPTVTLSEDICDIKGKVLVPKGQTYNPLKHRTLSTQLVLIEGRDKEQVEWAIRQKKSKIILVNGSPLDIEEQYTVPIYFDQGGFLCQKFGVGAFPARVYQTGERLTCEEIEVLS